MFLLQSNFTHRHINCALSAARQVFLHLMLFVSSCRCVGNNIMLLTKAFRKKFIIPDFEKFVHQIGTMYDIAHRQEGGQVSKKTNTHTLILCPRHHFQLTHVGFTSSCRSLITFHSWLSSALISGAYLCAQSMDRGVVPTPLVIHLFILKTSTMCTASLTLIHLFKFFIFGHVSYFSITSSCHTDTLWVTPRFPSVCSHV